MFCRICGHENESDKGPCSNCGYDLGFQVLPASEQRKGLQKTLDMDLRLEGSDHIEAGRPRHTGYLGIVLGLIGLVVCVFVLVSFERVEVTSEPVVDMLLTDVPEIPLDSLPIRVGSDIVYTLNPTGTSAEPHTNLNLSLIPEGSTVAFVGHASLTLKPLVTFIDQKNREGAQARLRLDNLCMWTDSTETGFVSVPLIVQPAQPDTTQPLPVTLKLIFTNEWLVGRVEEFQIEIPAPLPSGAYSEAKLDSVLYQVDRRLASRDIEGRPVEVIAMFAESTSLGDAFPVMSAVLPNIEERGYRGLGLKYFLLES